ncbi:MAG: Gx transporter family protein [Lachnospiraceae bacterium]|nr:Gx transporter family protein [Lachnospiraceae bacterium]
MKSKKIALFGLLIALAFVLSYIESLIPVFIAIPGVKLGLTNLVVLIALINFGKKEALFINVIRIILVGLSFGNAYSLLYSLAGGILSFAAMSLLLRKKTFSTLGISVAGGVCHNIGQIVVASFVLETGALVYYLPVLMISGTIAGVLVGILCGEIVKRLPPLND